MNTNLNSPMPAARSWSSESWAAIAGAIGSTLLLARRLLSFRAGRPESLGRADFYAELASLKDQVHAGQLAILERLDANQRALLAALERHGDRINALETGLARVDERTRK